MHARVLGVAQGGIALYDKKKYSALLQAGKAVWVCNGGTELKSRFWGTPGLKDESLPLN